MKLTVITVCFNSRDTISQNIESVAKQTYPNIEHIIIDGASTDGTVDAISISGNKITKFISEPDKGIYDAMNKGIKLATGDYIGFLNADDLYASHKSLEHIAQALLAEELDAVFGDIEFFKPNNPKRIIRRYDSAHFNPKKLAWGWMPAHPGLFLHKSIFEQYGLFNSDYRIAGDFEFIARVFYKGELKYRYLAEVLVRMRTGGISTQGWRNTLLLNQEVLRACRENNITTNYFKLLLKYPVKCLEFLKPWLSQV